MVKHECIRKEDATNGDLERLVNQWVEWECDKIDEEVYDEEDKGKLKDGIREVEILHQRHLGEIKTIRKKPVEESEFLPQNRMRDIEILPKQLLVEILQRRQVRKSDKYQLRLRQDVTQNFSAYPQRHTLNLKLELDQ